MHATDATRHLSQDPVLRQLIQRIELPANPPSRRVYFDLLESIVYQQLNIKVASVIFNRFLDLFPDRYPHPEPLIAFPPETLRSAGLSAQKASYLQNIARFSLEFDLEQHDWDSMGDEEIIDLLTRIKGVGRWTAQMLIMFTLGRPDVFPTDDLGIQQAIQELYQLQEEGKALKTKMVEIAESWRPHRTLACRYLWRRKE